MLPRLIILSGHKCECLLSLTRRFTCTTPVKSKICPPVKSNICTPEKSDSKSDSSGAPKAPSSERPVRQEPGKVRMGIFPEEWFAAFYNKTGVTGPYALGLTVATYLISKEYYVMEHEYYNGLSVLILAVFTVKKVGPFIRDFIDKELDAYEAGWNIGRNSQKQALEAQIKNEEENQWSLEGQLMLCEAKRENVALQLEAHYRKRLLTVYEAVKQRLDYQLQVTNVEHRIAQKHLVRWVVKQVLSSMTPEQEKQNIDKCLADLKAMSKE